MTHNELLRLGPGAPACPDCNRCPCSDCHPVGACERVARGRRFFLLGALALPVVQKIGEFAPKIVLAAPETTLRFAAKSFSWALQDAVRFSANAWFAVAE